MERQRSKRSYHHYEYPDSHSPSPPPRSKTRYDSSADAPPSHRRASRAGQRRRGHHHPTPPTPPPPPPPPLPSQQLTSSASASAAVSSPRFQDCSPPAASSITTFFRILCPDVKCGGVIGKSGSIVKAFRQDTGAWINVHQLVPGDEERIIETSDSRRREADGRPPEYSPAQEALLLIHERILEVELELACGNDGEGYGDRGRVTTRLVVPRTHVGCLLGKGGKIIEQMRVETRTHIRILPRDQYTPRCVSLSEEVVQVAGEGNCVKKAVEIISSRLKESLHRDRGSFRGRLYSPGCNFPPDDEFLNSAQDLAAVEEYDLGSKSSAGPNKIRRISFASKPSAYEFDQDGNPINGHLLSFSCEDLVFRILCPNDKVESLMGVSDGIIQMLQADVGVDVHVTDPVPGSDERVIVITSDEGPDDDLFPAQEALLHIQTHIVDLGPDKDNIITTRLLVPASEIASLEGRDGSLSDIRRSTSANVQILPKEDLPPCAMEADELLQIVGEIRAARNALVQVTAKLRSYLYRDISVPDMLPQATSAPSRTGDIVRHESPVKVSSRETYHASEPAEVYQRINTSTLQVKDNGGSASGSSEQKESNASDEGRQSIIKGLSVPLITKSTLEVIIPKHAVPSLTMRSGNKLSLISQMSGAAVTLIEDRTEQTQKIVQISGSPEQAEKARSLLLGFILSTQDDLPSS